MQRTTFSVNHLRSAAGAVINWFVGRRLRNERFIGIVACAAVGISTVLAFFWPLNRMARFARHSRDGSPVDMIQVGTFRAISDWRWIRLSGIYVLFITFVGFSHSRFRHRLHERRLRLLSLFRLSNLFMFAMLTLVLADNFLLMFVGWKAWALLVSADRILPGQRTRRRPQPKKLSWQIALAIGEFVLGLMLIFFMDRLDQFL
jgi:NADH-quinone oxidoreductase subunit L